MVKRSRDDPLRIMRIDGETVHAFALETECHLVWLVLRGLKPGDGVTSRGEETNQCHGGSPSGRAWS